MVREKLEVNLPKKIEFRDHGNGIEITRTWFGLGPVLGLVLGFFFVLLSLVYVSRSIENASSLSILGGILWFVSSLIMIYMGVVGIVNKTKVMVDHSHLAVRHGPVRVPFMRNWDIRSGDIKQLYSEKDVFHTEDGTVVTYLLHALTVTGKDLKLLKGLKSREQALFIEQVIEKYLGIEDKVVEGEIPH